MQKISDLQRKSKGGRPPLYDKTKWLKLYNAGCGDAEIARQEGCCHTTVIYWRCRNGLPPIGQKRGPGVSVSYKIEQIQAALQNSPELANSSNHVIARSVGCHVATVKKFRSSRNERTA